MFLDVDNISYPVQPLGEIQNMKEFLGKCLKTTSIFNYTSKSLTKPGDNYNSQLQAVDVNLFNPNDSKVIPITNSLRLKLISL